MCSSDLAADMALAAIFPAQPPTFNLQWGIRDGLFAVFWERKDAAFIHGNVFWVGDTLVIFARVNPLQMYDRSLPLAVPIVQTV